MSFSLLISSIENLSNEIFYEIFEYLDFSDTYHAFSNLNSRFHQLIMSSSLLVNFFVPNRPKFDMEYYCEHIIITNRHRIIALRNLTSPLIEKLLTQCFIDESFSRLENLTFYRVLIKEISPILPYLNLLPRLSSLTISINQFEDPDLDRIDLNGIYEMVFDLPVLKYFDFNPSHGICSGFNDSETTEKLSTIESLTLGHYFSVDVLISFLKRTPRLRHLTCASLYDTPDRIDNDVPLVLPNLTYLWIYYCTVPLDELQHTVKKHFSQLHVFRINTFHNESYIDPDRWKPLIVQTMPQLRRFHFTYNLHWNDNFIDDHFDSFVHHFSSSSWLRRDFMVRLHVTSGFINYSLQSNGYGR
jgi:hypothetical protein